MTPRQHNNILKFAIALFGIALLIAAVAEEIARKRWH